GHAQERFRNKAGVESNATFDLPKYPTVPRTNYRLPPAFFVRIMSRYLCAAIYFQPNHLNIYRMPAAGGPAQQVTHFPESGLFIEEPAISPDNRYLVYCRSNGGSSLWLLKIGTAGSGSN